MKNYQLEEITTAAKLRSQLADIFRTRASPDSRVGNVDTATVVCLSPAVAWHSLCVIHRKQAKERKRERSQVIDILLFKGQAEVTEVLSHYYQRHHLVRGLRYIPNYLEVFSLLFPTGRALFCVHPSPRMR